MKVKCPQCKKLFVNAEFLEKHMPEHPKDTSEPKSKGWATPYGFGDWTHPITYKEACEEMKKMTEKFIGDKVWKK